MQPVVMRLLFACLPLAGSLVAPQLIMDVAEAAARAAGRHMASRVGAAAVLETKLDSADLVTAVDKECQDIIEARIRESFPGHALLGEESVPPGVDAAMEALSLIEDEFIWIVDPNDGTTNFVSGLPLCAISIAVAQDGERHCAVVYDPFRDELFSAVRGEGAFLNGKPIRASGVVALREAVLCACSPHSERSVGPALRSITELMPRARSIRILGSGVLNFAWVACGRLGAYWEPELAPWDSAAGTLLVEEAGGTVSNLAGEAYALQTIDVLACAAGIHGELIEAFERCDATGRDTVTPEPLDEEACEEGDDPVLLLAARVAAAKAAKTRAAARANQGSSIPVDKRWGGLFR